MSSQWPEVWRIEPIDQFRCDVCKTTVAVYVRYYPNLWQGERPKYLCQDCKEAQDMKMRAWTEKKEAEA